MEQSEFETLHDSSSSDIEDDSSTSDILFIGKVSGLLLSGLKEKDVEVKKSKTQNFH